MYREKYDAIASEIRKGITDDSVPAGLLSLHLIERGEYLQKVESTPTGSRLQLRKDTHCDIVGAHSQEINEESSVPGAIVENC
jgi:hypothetical protein